MCAQASLELGGEKQGPSRGHIVPRLRALLDIVLNIDVLVKTRDIGSWLTTWLVYLGIVGAMLTAIITAATRGVIYAANNVLRPHALPIISPALEKLFISWPQLAIGMGFHAHIITGLYFAAPAYTVAALLMLVAKDPLCRGLLLPRGVNRKDVFDHFMLWLVFLSAALAGPLAAAYAERLPAAGWQMLAPHIALGALWIIYSLAARGLAYRVAGTALALLHVVIFNRVPREVFSDLLNNPWAATMLASFSGAAAGR